MASQHWYHREVERDALELASGWSFGPRLGHHPDVGPFNDVIDIRAAEREDIPTIRDLLRSANAEFVKIMGRTLFDGYLSNVLDVEARMLVGNVLVAQGSHTIVGTVSWYREATEEGMGAFPAGTAGLRAMAVAPGIRGRGIGRALVDACLEQARLAGARAMVLHTAPYMLVARRVYEQAGFTRQPDLDFDSAPFFGGGPKDRLPALGFRIDLRR